MLTWNISKLNTSFLRTYNGKAILDQGALLYTHVTDGFDTHLGGFDNHLTFESDRSLNSLWSVTLWSRWQTHTSVIYTSCIHTICAIISHHSARYKHTHKCRQLTIYCDDDCTGCVTSEHNYIVDQQQRSVLSSSILCYITWRPPWMKIKMKSCPHR